MEHRVPCMKELNRPLKTHVFENERPLLKTGALRLDGDHAMDTFAQHQSNASSL